MFLSFQAVFCIPIGFSVDPDPAIYLNADPNSFGSGSGAWSDIAVTKS